VFNSDSTASRTLPLGVGPNNDSKVRVAARAYESLLSGNDAPILIGGDTSRRVRSRWQRADALARHSPVLGNCSTTLDSWRHTGPTETGDPMKRIIFAMALVGAGLLAGFAVGTLFQSSGPSQSYTDGYAYGAYIDGTGNPMGGNSCTPGAWDVPIPKGDNLAQYSRGCSAGFNNAFFKIPHPTGPASS